MKGIRKEFTNERLIYACVATEGPLDDEICRLNMQIILTKPAYMYSPFMTKYLGE